jgi:hypothetical protein
MADAALLQQLGRAGAGAMAGLDLFFEHVGGELEHIGLAERRRLTGDEHAIAGGLAGDLDRALQLLHAQSRELLIHLTDRFQFADGGGDSIGVALLQLGHERDPVCRGGDR